MPVIARFFLRAKHWKIFLLLFGMGFLEDVAAINSSLVHTRSLLDLWKSGFLTTAAVTALFMFCFLCWFWAMGTFLDSVLQPALRLEMKIFRLALIYPVVYLPIFMVFFLSLSVNPLLFAIIFPLHFLAMSCMFYVLYFVSKSLVLAETGKAVSFYDYAGPFFLLWFFPIGIWFTQPRINRLYAERMNSEPVAG
jgi:hypothetical protein